jgi:hypothetical protein
MTVDERREPEGLPTEEWRVGPRSHRRALVAIAVGALIVGLLVASLAVLYPYLEANYFGAAPVWHPFNSVFSSSGQVISDSCSVKDLQPIFGGMGAEITVWSVVSCSFHGATYLGYFGFDCNVSPSGPPRSINGSLVPYEGCVLGQAPLNYTFVGVFSLGLRANGSTPIYSNEKVVANITATQAWRSFSCSMKTDNISKSNGPMTCDYDGAQYSSTAILQSCDILNPVQVNGIPIPNDSCNLQRSDLASLANA